MRGFFQRRYSGSGELAGNARLGAGNGVAARLVTVGQTFGTHDLDVGDTEEVQHQLEVVLVGDTAGLAGMDAAGGGDDDDFLAASQASGPLSV